MTLTECLFAFFWTHSDPEGLSGGDEEVTEEVDFGDPSEDEENGVEEWDD